MNWTNVGSLPQWSLKNSYWFSLLNVKCFCTKSWILYWLVDLFMKSLTSFWCFWKTLLKTKFTWKKIVKFGKWLFERLRIGCLALSAPNAKKMSRRIPSDPRKKLKNARTKHLSQIQVTNPVLSILFVKKMKHFQVSRFHNIKIGILLYWSYPWVRRVS